LIHYGKENISAAQKKPENNTWVPVKNENIGRATGYQQPKEKRQEKACSLGKTGLLAEKISGGY